MQEAFTPMQTRLAQLEKKRRQSTTRARSQACRLKSIVSWPEEQQAVLVQISSRRGWILEMEPIFAGAFASQPEESSPAAVGQRLHDWLHRLATFLPAPERSEEEPLRLGQVLPVQTHLRPWLVQCSDGTGFPRPTQEMEPTMRALTRPSRRGSSRKNWTGSLLRYGRCVASQEWWQQQPAGQAH